MDFTKLTKNISVALNQEELKKLIILRDRNIKTIDIFRCGLDEMIKRGESKE